MMGTCSSCVHRHAISINNPLRHTCMNPKLVRTYTLDAPVPDDGALVEHDEGWAIVTGPNFGCVLHEAPVKIVAKLRPKSECWRCDDGNPRDNHGHHYHGPCPSIIPLDGKPVMVGSMNVPSGVTEGDLLVISVNKRTLKYVITRTDIMNGEIPWGWFTESESSDVGNELLNSKGEKK